MRFDAQHTAQVIGTVRTLLAAPVRSPARCLHRHRTQLFRRRMQPGELHAIPFPALPGGTGQPVANRAVGQQFRRHRGHQPAGGHRGQHRARAADVIVVVVRHRQHIEMVDAFPAQVRHDDTVAAVGLRAPHRPGVVQQRMVLRARQHGKALAHVEHRQPQLTGARSARRHCEHRHHQYQAQHTRGNAAWRQQPGHAQHRQRQCPQRRRMLLPHRDVQRRQPIQKKHQPFKHPMRQLQQTIEGQHRARQRQRRHHQAHHRDGQCIGQRRRDRHLAEQHQQQRREADADRPLHDTPTVQPAALGQSAAAHVKNQRHRAERQPEPR